MTTAAETCGSDACARDAPQRRQRSRWAGAAVACAAAVVVASAVLVAGCGWLRWRALAETHVQLLDRLAADALETYAAENQVLEPGDIERLRYPLERAREFAASSHRRFGATPWLARFDELVAVYAEITDWLDRARARAAADADRVQARELTARVHAAAAGVRSALEPD